MKKKMLIVLIFCATPLLIAKLIDVHLPTKEELYQDHTKDKDRMIRDAFDTLDDRDATIEEKDEAYNVLMDNGVMA